MEEDRYLDRKEEQPDVEGHVFEQAEMNEEPDVEGHVFEQAEMNEEPDVEGHVFEQAEHMDHLEHME